MVCATREWELSSFDVTVQGRVRSLLLLPARRRPLVAVAVAVRRTGCCRASLTGPYRNNRIYPDSGMIHWFAQI